MTGLVVLIPVALFLAIAGLLAFLWSLRSGQFDDLQGAAHRILEDDGPLDTPPTPAEKKDPEEKPDE